MKNYQQLFNGKKITLMGLGLLGRGVGDAAFLAEAGADLTVTDLKSAADLAMSLEPLKKYKNIRFVLGEHRLEDFQKNTGAGTGADLVVKAAGVPMDSPFILEAQKHGVPVTMSTVLFAEYTEAKVVGITGTRGKSTVAYLLYEILKAHAAQAEKEATVFLGGNILGVSTLDLLSKTKMGDTAVLELDSWQLQGFAGSHGREFPAQPEGFSPPVAVFTTFMSDHMNYYANDMERYFADKANIYRFQEAGDVLVVSEQVAEYIKKFGPEPKAKVVIARVADVPTSWKIKIPGEHNRLNVALALATAKAMGVSEKIIQQVVENFKAAPGRLEHIRTYRGIDIYNDTNATTSEATIAALKAFERDDKKNEKELPRTVLIFGGADKKLDPKPLLEILPDYAKALVVLPGTGTDLIRAELEKMATTFAGKLPIVFVKSMNEAVEQAFEHARIGDRVLMSPAFASFGLFKNEYDRGDQFNAIVKGL